MDIMYHNRSPDKTDYFRDFSSELNRNAFRKGGQLSRLANITPPVRYNKSKLLALNSSQRLNKYKTTMSVRRKEKLEKSMTLSRRLETRMTDR